MLAQDLRTIASYALNRTILEHAQKHHTTFHNIIIIINIIVVLVSKY